MELIPTVTNPDNVIVSRAKDLCREMELEKAYLHREIDKNNKSVGLAVQFIEYINGNKT